MIAIAKDIDVVRDLGGGEWRRRWLLRLRRGGKRARDDCRYHAREMNPQHCVSSRTLASTDRRRPNEQPAAAMLIPVPQQQCPANDRPGSRTEKLRAH